MLLNNQSIVHVLNKGIIEKYHSLKNYFLKKFIHSSFQKYVALIFTIIFQQHCIKYTHTYCFEIFISPLPPLIEHSTYQQHLSSEPTTKWNH